MRWNSPFYGVEGQGWFLSYHVFARYVKVTFLKGKALDPMPPVDSKDPDARYYHIHQDGHGTKRSTLWSPGSAIGNLTLAASIPGWELQEGSSQLLGDEERDVFFVPKR